MQLVLRIRRYGNIPSESVVALVLVISKARVLKDGNAAKTRTHSSQAHTFFSSIKHNGIKIDSIHSENVLDTNRYLTMIIM